MIKPNWDIFKAKFSENPQENFEWFCYLLFCNEHDMTKGIFRYKNQSAIETEPIQKDNKVIGWQAKFYDVSLSQKNKEIIKTLEKVKTDYPNLTDLIFYTNQEWGQGQGGKEPKGKNDAEKKAKELGINLEWRVKSFFESEFVSIQNEHIAKYFFMLDSNLDNAVEKSKEHTQLLLKGIDTGINYNGKVVEVDRTKTIEKLERLSRKIIILSGEAGVGKTSLIKSFYEKIENNFPFYLIKATEFINSNINILFNGFAIDDFIDAHKEEENKIFVIDSAEKLLDIDNIVFKELFSNLLKNDWKIIFTTRNSYLNEISFELNQVYNIEFENISIENLSKNELLELSTKYNFELPKNIKLKTLIQNPFYLSQYLKSYQENKNLSFLEFKRSIWKKTINSNQEQCFLKVAKQRADKGSFYVEPLCEQTILNSLKNSSVLDYVFPHGYFITHDIYEEWALEFVIEREFLKRDNNTSFFSKIGDSLPIRRSFRSWISEKLLLNDEDIKLFIEDIINDRDIEPFWKDEVLISILLSDYSDTFFKNFKQKLSINNFEITKKISFLLRLACKEADVSYFNKVGITDIEPIKIMSMFSKPKGHGWQAFINYTYQYIDDLETKDILWILPILSDCYGKLEHKETERKVALLALNFYKKICKEKYYRDKEQVEKLSKIAINGSQYIVDELKEILDEVLINRWKYHNDKYYDLSKLVLSGLWGVQTTSTIPKYVLKLANLFWRYTPKESIESSFGIRDDDSFYDRLERAYGIEKNGIDYYPASAYQTPIYNLLKSDFQNTLDFVLKFINESVKIYSKSKYTEYLLTVKVKISEKFIVEHYHDISLWLMYRGMDSSPKLLQSIHMALENYLLEIAKDLDEKSLEILLIYLLQNTISSSISAVVASVVVAYPDKTFNVAKILLQTKEFIIYDFNRKNSEILDTNPLDFGFSKNIEQKIFDEERKKSDKLEHRNKSLEEMCLFYQLFRSDGVSEKEADKRQKVLWKILDNYYKKLDSSDDKIWKMSLSRMDRRKMDIQFEEKEKGYLISFDPKLTDELKEYREKAQEEYKEDNKYLEFNLWAKYRLDNDVRYKQYDKYENNPKLTFQLLSEVVEKLKNKKDVLIADIPVNVSLVLLKEYKDELSKKEKIFCKDILIDIVKKHSNTPKTKSIISFLPYLMSEFPDDKDNIKKLLFKLLCLGYEVSNIWDYFDDANSLLIGYLVLKPKYISSWDKKRKESSTRYDMGFDTKKFDIDFMRDNNDIIEMMLNNTLSLKDIQDYSTMDDEVLIQAFNFLPDKLEDDNHKIIAKSIIENISTRLLVDKSDFEFSMQDKFIKKLSYILLTSTKKEIDSYLKIFIKIFNGSEVIAEFFVELIILEDKIHEYDKFWYIWELFEDNIINLCKSGDEYWFIDKIIKAYFLAKSNHAYMWKQEVKEWEVLKEKDIKFLRDISYSISHCPSVLYSISILLTSIGSKYEEIGVAWISKILRDNQQILEKNLDSDAVFHIEIFVRIYILKNIANIKKNSKIKNDILEILNFLVLRGSAIGYMLRERIL
jgi:hypothetical protein